MSKWVQHFKESAEHVAILYREEVSKVLGYSERYGR